MLTNKDLWLTTSCGMIELIEEHIVLATKGNKLIFKK